MIKANEIRIGNYVSLKCGTHVPIADGGILAISQKRFECSPIHLTPEILEKCGFRMYCEKSIKTEWDNNPRFSYQYLCKNDRFIVTHTPSDDADRTFRAANDLIVKHLHQLQNLYWCLCGKELEINLQ